MFLTNKLVTSLQNATLSIHTTTSGGQNCPHVPSSRFHTWNTIPLHWMNPPPPPRLQTVATRWQREMKREWHICIRYNSSGTLCKHEIPQSQKDAVVLVVCLDDRESPPKPMRRWKVRLTRRHLCYSRKGYFRHTTHSALSRSRIAVTVWGSGTCAF